MDIVGIGNLTTDFLINLDAMPKPDSFARINVMCWQSGGKISNAMTAAARLGAKTSCIAILGDDENARFSLEDFHYNGVDTSGLVVEPGRRNTFSTTISLNDSGTRSFLVRPEDIRLIRDEDIDYDLVASARILEIDTIVPGVKKACDVIHEAGGLVVIDAERYRAEFEESIAAADILIASEDYYRQFYGDSAEYEKNCLEYKKKYGYSAVVFTFGKRGCIGLSDDYGFFKLPAFKDVKVVDTTGAGDAFHGGFMFGMVRGMNARDCAELAGAVSTIKCTRIGSRTALPNCETLEKFMKTGEIDYAEIDAREQYYMNIR